MTSRENDDAAIAGAGLVDRDARGRLEIAGRDRAGFLQGLLTNDITLERGEGCYAALLSPQGRMVADMRVVELGDRMLVDLHESVADAVRQRLEGFIFSEDVRISNLCDRWTCVGVHGPAAARAVSSLLGGGERFEAGLAALSEHHAREASFQGAPVVVVRSGDLGLMGFDLYADRAVAAALSDALQSAGVTLLALETREALRIEAGRPEFTVDMDDQTIPLEAGIESRAISLSKGCYVGQEVVIRILHRGQGRVVRRLVGLRVETDGASDLPVPQKGDAILAAGREVGRVTSGARSPRIGGPVALGYVHRDVTEPGTALEIRVGERTIRAVVSVLPFTDASKRSG